MENDIEPNFAELTLYTYGKKEISYYTKHITWTVLEVLQNAEFTVKANMAYLSNELIISNLINLSKKGISVEMIISNTDNNKKMYGVYNELLANNVKIFEFGSDSWKNGIMHRKSVIIDDKVVLSGSYNWTEQADRNTEELFIIEDIDTIKEVEIEFENLKTRCNALIYQKAQIGSYSKCSKEKEVELEKWWNQLNDSWKIIFNEKFNVGLNPSIDILISLVNSETISINYSDIADLTPIEQFTNLKNLTVYSCKNIKDLSPLKNILTLEYLDIAATSVYNLEPISGLINLEELNISNTKIDNIDPINNLKLKRLFLVNLNFPFFGSRPKFFSLNPNCKINDFS